MTSNHPASLFGGMDATLNVAFGVESYRREATVKAMRTRPPTSEVGSDVARRVYNRIADVFPGLIENLKRRPPSNKNWRLYSPGYASKNNLGEVGLERAFVRECKVRGRNDWWNQVPVASGLMGSTVEKRRAIDLVKYREGLSYEFVELKLGSNSALYATVQILQYGAVWLLSRKFNRELGYPAGTLLDANDIRLNVLAPRPYFRDVDFDAFESGVSAAVREIGAAQNVSMDFRLVRFPENFSWRGEYSGDLCALLDELFISNYSSVKRV